MKKVFILVLVCNISFLQGFPQPERIFLKTINAACDLYSDRSTTCKRKLIVALKHKQNPTQFKQKRDIIKKNTPRNRSLISKCATHLRKYRDPQTFSPRTKYTIHFSRPIPSF